MHRRSQFKLGGWIYCFAALQTALSGWVGRASRTSSARCTGRGPAAALVTIREPRI